MLLLRYVRLQFLLPIDQLNSWNPYFDGGRKFYVLYLCEVGGGSVGDGETWSLSVP